MKRQKLQRKKRSLLRLCFAICALLCTGGIAAQSSLREITLSAKDQPLEQIIRSIESQIGMLFIINNEVNTSQTLSISLNKEPLTEALHQIFDPINIQYGIQGKHIILSNKPLASSDVEKTATLKISGTITDVNKEPIIGATVVVKDSSLGTITGIDGDFHLQVPRNSILEISYVGYISQYVNVNNSTMLNIVLKEDSKALDEVVVVGYGVQRKRDVTTSISSVKSNDIANLSATDFRNTLAGKMPGVQVMQPSGDPEGNVSIRVRGVSSITAGNDPLYIIDGIPVERGFANLNNNDIESIEVLKDASSAAIYGSRGSNGVVIITTKKGTTEKLTVSYDGYYGSQSVLKKIDLMNAYQFAQFVKDGHDNAYLDEVPSGSVDDPNSIRPQSYHRIPLELYPYLNGQADLTDTDWQNAIFRQANTTGHNISLSGKVNNVNYFVSGGYMYKEGTILNSDFRKYNLRLNLDAKYGKFKYGVNFAPSYSKSNRVDASGANGIVQSALMMAPVWSVYNEDGSYNYKGNGYWRIGTDYQHNAVLNPVAMANLSSDIIDRMAMVGKLFAEYEFFKGFSYNIAIGGDFYGAINNQYRSSELPLLGYQYYDQRSNPTGYSSSGFYFNWLVENKLSYNTIIGSDHSLNAILVQSIQKETYKGNSITATDYPNDYIQTISGGTVSKGSSEITQWSLASFLTRVQYSYKGRYLMSAAVRTDGSSRFGRQNRWGWFPSVSAAWRMSDENFFRNKEALSFVDDLKIKASYGITGNFQIGNYEHLATMASDDYVIGTGSGSLASGYKPTSILNEDLTWEKTAMANVGIDLLLWKGLLGVIVDLYNSNTSDLLLNVPVPHLTGYSTTRMNIGKVNNRGIDIQLTSQKQFQNGFHYTLTANWSRNINKVISLGATNTPIISTGSVNHAYYITEVQDNLSGKSLRFSSNIL